MTIALAFTLYVLLALAVIGLSSLLTGRLA